MYTLFINVTKECNLDCTRCYLHEQSRSTKSLLSIDTAEKFLCNAHFAQKVSQIVLQGGEINLVSVDHIEDLLKLCRYRHPNATIRIVSNLLGVKPEFFSLLHEYCESNIETTFALNSKSLKNGDEQLYKEVFCATAWQYYNQNISISSNFELNIESLLKGASEFYNYVAYFPPSYWDFDLSLDFKSFLRDQEYSRNGTPLIKATVSYKQFWDYLLDLKVLKDDLNAKKIEISFFKAASERVNNQFSAGQLGCFYTLNPDGYVTTNPLYSDLKSTFIGNVEDLVVHKSDVWKRLFNDELIRLKECSSCERFRSCGGSITYVQLHDGSGECVGGKTARPLIEAGV